MKKYINNKKYDTTTAKKVGVWDNDCNYNDFAYCGETLYKKKNGEFFIYGEGGPLSKYARHYGAETSGSEKITPLTYEEAQKWAEEHLSGDEYEAIFGEIPEDDGEMKKLNIYLPAVCVEKLKRKSSQTGKSVSELIEEYAKTL